MLSVCSFEGLDICYNFDDARIMLPGEPMPPLKSRLHVSQGFGTEMTVFKSETNRTGHTARTTA